MILYLNRSSDEAFACTVETEPHVRKRLFEEGRRQESSFTRLDLHDGVPVRFRALAAMKLDVTTLDPPDGLLL